MLKKTITYKDLDGNPVTDDFYFSLSKAELAELEVGHKGGFSEYLRTIISTSDAKAIIASFKDILHMAYGKRSEDGKRFMKSEELWLEFYETDAYSQIFMELVTDAEASAAFVKAIVPSDLAEQMAKSEKVVELPQPTTPTDDPYSGMSREELIRALSATPVPETTDDAS